MTRLPLFRQSPVKRGPWDSRICPSGIPTSGFTLLELATALTLLALALSHLLPTARRGLDRMAVIGAREELAGLVHRTRMAAVAHGGASLLIEAEPPRAAIRVGSELRSHTDLQQAYGVVLTLSRDREEVELRYDALGLGRVASQTVLLTRGEAVASLVVSSFGRVSRR